VKLLFDENLSHRLSQLVATEYPESVHVRHVGLLGADDAHIWEHARAGGYAIVSKDSDFRQRSFLEATPPKVVWLDVGNAGTQAIADLLRREQPQMEAFAGDEEAALLVLTIVGVRT
jgi:predicted nuclease of predicted toxin-antitoxin system